MDRMGGGERGEKRLGAHSDDVLVGDAVVAGELLGEHPAEPAEVVLEDVPAEGD